LPVSLYHVIWKCTFLTETENYNRCYGKNELKFGSKPVLIVIDCVRAYHDPTSPLYAPERFDKALKSILRLIEKCRAVKIPVVYTSVIYETPQSGGKWYMEKLPNVLCCYDAGNPFRDFAEGVEPRKDEVVVLKQYSSSFFGTSLSSLLASWGCDCTILCGYSTSGCVRATGKHFHR
jgi:maleamate amidohydrolase